MKLDGENLGDNFLGCIVNFCQPIEWSRGAKLTEVSDLLRNSVKVIHVVAKIADLKKLPVQAVLIANVNNASTIYHRYFI